MSENSVPSRQGWQRSENGPQLADERPRDDRFGLEEALDGELPEETVSRMIEHARGCPECAEELARLRALKAVVRRSCGAETAPSTLRERISVQYRRIEVSHDGGLHTSIETSTARRVER